MNAPIDVFLLHTLSENCLKAASEGRAVDLQETINEGADIEFERIGLNPLQAALAAAVPHWECVDLLLDAGANVNVRNRQGWSLLHQASKEGWTEFAQRLIDKSAMAWISDLYDVTPLHAASESGNTDIVKMLTTGEVRDTLNIDALDIDGESPLMKAARAGHLGVCQVLVARGADFEIKNNQGQTAKDLADPHPDLADWLGNQVAAPKAAVVEDNEVLAPLVDMSYLKDHEEAHKEVERPKMSSITKRKLG